MRKRGKRRKDEEEKKRGTKLRGKKLSTMILNYSGLESQWVPLSAKTVEKRREALGGGYTHVGSVNLPSPGSESENNGNPAFSSGSVGCVGIEISL